MSRAVRALPRVLALTIALTAMMATGCTSNPAPTPPPSESPAPTPDPPEPPEPGDRASEPAQETPTPAATLPAPWQLAPGSAPSQRLFRLRFEGPQGDGTLRLVLRLASSERYRLSVSDRLGRPVYTLSASPGAGLMLDHRRRRFCTLPGSIRVEGVPVDPLPLPALPRLLLGRLPVPPGDLAGPAGPDGASDAEELELVDGEGRRWTARVDDGGAVVSWTLWERDEPAAWWQALDDGEDAERVLSDRVRGIQMTWREVAREGLPLPLDVVGIPSGFVEGGCGDLLEAATDGSTPTDGGGRLTGPGERL